MPKFDKSALSAEALEYVESLESQVEDLTKSADLGDDAEAVAFAKAVEALPPAQRAIVRKQQRELIETRDVAAKLLEKSEGERFLKMAQALVHIPGVTPDEASDTLRKAAYGDAKAVEAMYEMLKAADAYIAENDKLTEELGSSFDGQPGSAQERIAALAKEAMKADPKLSEAEAMTKAVREHPELYRDHKQES